MRRDAGDEQHGAKPQQHPRADDAHRGEREIEIAEPAARDAAEPDELQRLVDDAVAGKHPAPGDAGRDQRDHLRDEQHGARRGAEAAAQMIADGGGYPQPDGDRKDGEVDDELEGVAEHLQQLGVGQDHEIIVETRELSPCRCRPSAAASSRAIFRSGSGRRLRRRPGPGR